RRARIIHGNGHDVALLALEHLRDALVEAHHAVFAADPLPQRRVGVCGSDDFRGIELLPPTEHAPDMVMDQAGNSDAVMLWHLGLLTECDRRAEVKGAP